MKHNALLAGVDRAADGAWPSAWPRGTLLSFLTPDASRRLLARGAGVEYASGEIVFRQGDAANHAVLLLAGYVKLTASEESGQAVLLDIHGAGDIIGTAEILDQGPRLATATAERAVTAVIIRREPLRNLMAMQPELAMALTQDLARQLRRSTRRRTELAALPVQSRVIRILADLARSHGQRTRNGIVLRVGLTVVELATLVGASEVSVHRALRSLRNTGAITTGRRQIIIAIPGAFGLGILGEEDTAVRAAALKEFSESLRALRARAGTPTAEELAATAGISRTTVRDALAGGWLPRWSTTQRLVEALGGDPEHWKGIWARAARATAPPKERRDGQNPLPGL